MTNHIVGSQIPSEKKKLLPFAFVLILLEALLFFKALSPMVFGLVSLTMSGLIGMIAYVTYVFMGETRIRHTVLSEITCSKCGHKNTTASELCLKCGHYLDRAHN